MPAEQGCLDLQILQIVVALKTRSEKPTRLICIWLLVNLLVVPEAWMESASAGVTRMWNKTWRDVEAANPIASQYRVRLDDGSAVHRSIRIEDNLSFHAASSAPHNNPLLNHAKLG